ncbi:hypothetical protein FDG50_03270 [Clostridium botulinum]|uniref:hypothetical protein n=1 Tax=Clostridium botulinum TaxID=1491 RepID=UPI0013FE5D29|nr:hypothetical protein [Clostridium botulinum]MBY6836550.1 hypothetical protein [Clostridium botulinum]NFG64173.1 hypothetical protein [Clostridium botulinum]NFQ23166.1 hypothetical protein [Clostridium botulinum]
MAKNYDDFKNIINSIEDINFRNKIIEWNEILDERCITLMIYLWIIKSGKYDDLLENLIDKEDSNMLIKFINLDNVNRKVVAFIYYYRFNALIDNLRNEHKKDYSEISKIFSYYVFYNELKEVRWCGSSYYYNSKLRKDSANLFRITKDIDEDNKKFKRIKKCIPFTQETVREIFNNSFNTIEEKNQLIKIFNKLITKQENTLAEIIIALAIGQVNGSCISLPSYSRSLGVVLFKYAHGKSFLIFRKKADINSIEFSNGSMCSFYDLSELTNRSLQLITNFSIDFSNIRDENMNNLNNWLHNLFCGKESICTYGSPILDRHVVNTFPINSDEALELSDMEFVFLLRIYRNMVYSKEISPKLDQEFSMVSEDIVLQLRSMIKAMAEIEINQEMNSEEWGKSIDNLNKLVTGIENLSEEEVRKIRNKMSFMDTIDWKKEREYFIEFINSKEELKFFYKTEKKSTEPLTWSVIKYTLLRSKEEKLTESN